MISAYSGYVVNTEEDKFIFYIFVHITEENGQDRPKSLLFPEQIRSRQKSGSKLNIFLE